MSSSFTASARRELFVEESGQESKQVPRSPNAFVDPVRTIWIGHHPELLARRYERIDQRLGALIVHVVVTGTVNHEELSLQLRRKSYRRALSVLIRMILRQPAISLLIDRVVVPDVGHRRH